MLAGAGCVHNVGDTTGALSTGGIIGIVLVAPAAHLWLEGHACLAIRRRQPDTMQQVLPSQKAGGFHNWQFGGSWICTALVDASGHMYAWWGSSE
jgi:hypothetical protein